MTLRSHLKLVLATTSLFLLAALIPSATQAQVATMDSISPSSSVTDITPGDEYEPDQRSTSNYQVFWLYTEIGEEYTANFSFDEMPLMVFVSGGKMSLEENWTRDEDEKTATVTFTSRDLQQVDAEVEDNTEEGQTLTTIAFIWEDENDSDGPDDHVDGAWVATDFQEYTLITGDTRFGAQVRGDAGDAGIFRMYMPPTAVSSMVENDDEHDSDGFDPSEDMGVYLGDNIQSGVEVRDDESGGAYVAFTATLSADDVVSGNEGGEEGEEGEGQNEIVDCDGDGEEDDNADEIPESFEGDPCDFLSGQSVRVAAGSALQVRVTAGPRSSGDTKPAKVKKKHVEVKLRKKKKVQLDWKNVSGADEYRVQLRKCKNELKNKCTKKKHFVKKKKWRKVSGISKSKKMVKKLKAGTFYQYRVRACNDAGCSGYTPWRRFKTKG